MSSNEYTSVQLNTDKPSQTYSKVIDKTEITISTRELRSSKPEIHYLLGPNEEILKTGNRTHSLEDLQLTPSSTRRGSTARTFKSPIKALSKLTKSILDLRHPPVQTERNTNVEDTEPVFEILQQIIIHYRHL